MHSMTNEELYSFMCQHFYHIESVLRELHELQWEKLPFEEQMRRQELLKAREGKNSWLETYSMERDDKFRNRRSRGL